MYQPHRYPKALKATWQIAFATTFFVMVAALVSALVAHAILEMRSSADELDDSRASRAAEAAVMSTKEKLSATVRDNAVWDDAYAAMDADGAAKWAYDNWGKTSEDYELYDGAVVIARDGSVLSAHWKGVPFDPFERFGPRFAQQVTAANRAGTDPDINFLQVDESIVLMGSSALQPYSEAPIGPSYNVLSFFKIIGPDVIQQISKEYQLGGLELVRSPASPGMLEVPIHDISDMPIAYLQWPSERPGTRVYQQVYRHLATAVALLVLFLAAVLVAGSAEAYRLRSLAAKEKWNATHDRLSGLLNRAGILEALTTLPTSEGGAIPSLHLLDLDGFKQVNDAWGHGVGDQLIKLVSQRLLSSYKENAVVARLGGDEFALIKLDGGDPLEFSKGIIAGIAEPFDIGGRTIEIGASIGFTSIESDTDPLELVRRADMSLYQAKESGRGQAAAFSPALDEERDRQATLEGQLRTAIQEGSIRAVFQPLVSAATGRISGVEALARWQTPAGSVSPEIFIPLAERSGLIDALGLKILEIATQAARDWHGLELAVNVSPIQLCNPTFPSQVLNLLERQDFDPARLTLEITEGVLMSNPEHARRAMDSLRTVGIKFALDDFGCGYASIGALRQFGFERMKIDRSLVWASENSGQGTHVLEATVALAAALEIPVTAEGVETSMQADLLRSVGCEQIQGYLVGKPMPAEELGQQIRRLSSAA
ncbi:MAG TPA: bifunctional diguanylate cyclase/phosphodiesterase [Pseudorhizobium sp.]|jgi:diguanylate cyclase (GGDEF)-like protein|nr:bifunctional diguanylate cyclase/phosphodiesterase [Pseudorhizobium sp.]